MPINSRYPLVLFLAFACAGPIGCQKSANKQPFATSNQVQDSTVTSNDSMHVPDSSLIQRYAHLMGGTRNYQGVFSQSIYSQNPLDTSYALNDTALTITVVNDSTIMISDKDYYTDTFRYIGRYQHSYSEGYDFDTLQTLVYTAGIVPQQHIVIEVYYYYHNDSICFFHTDGGMQYYRKILYHTR